MSRSDLSVSTGGDELVEKVVAIITRGSGAETEILVFRHRFSGPQLPAGTVERDEPVDLALLREVREETGLERVTAATKVSMLDERLAPDDLMVTERVTPLSEPRIGAVPVEGKVRRGMGFHCWGERAGYACIAYRQGDMASAAAGEADVKAWIPTSAISRRVRRHVYHLHPAEETPSEWVVKDAEADIGLDFLAYWAPLWGPLGLHPIQESWMRAGLDAVGMVVK